MIARETIYSTFFDLVKVAPGLKRTGRRLMHWSELSIPDQPALFMVQNRELAIVQTKLPTKWELKVDLWLYANTGGDEADAPMTILNPIIDAIVNKLLPPSHVGEQTLGGLVERCRIDGSVETDEGTLGTQAVVIIPVSILVPQ